VDMRFRLGMLLLVSATTLAVGTLCCGSPSAAVHFAVIPAFVTYVLMFRTDILKRARAYHLLYFAALAAAVAAYLVAFARITPQIRVRWQELPLGVYFLISVHIVVWLVDRLINRMLSACFGLPSKAQSPRGLYIPKQILRAACVAAVAAPYLIATFMTHWVKFADNTDPWRKMGIAFQQVRFDAADRATLEGWLIPAGRPSDATVIIAPGRGLTKACYLSHAKAFRDNGYNVLLFDLRGEGGSSGHTRSFGVLEARDVLGAVSYLRRAHPGASRHLFGFGISHGAAAIIAAAGADDRIEAVVVDSAFADAGSSLNRLTAPLPGPAGAYVRAATLLLASAELGCNLYEAGAVRKIAGVSPRPVLIVHGKADKVSGDEQAERLYAAAGEPKMLCKVANAGHGQCFLYAPEAYLAQALGVFRSVRESRPAFQ
jgi:alpha-beta hydrolase superfamily lysophospholipase